MGDEVTREPAAACTCGDTVNHWPDCAIWFDPEPDAAVIRRYETLDELSHENVRLRRALASLDGPIAWIAEHYPAAMEAMPAEHFQAIKDAGKVLCDE